VKAARVLWLERAQAWSLEKLVFIDESGAKTNMTRLRGRALKGQRAYDSAPHGHWCVTSMISSIRLDGTTACMTVDAATDGDVFLVYIRDILVPTLRPGDIVVLDNLSVHKHKDIAPLVEKVGATVEYLPPYSPDYNPIEKMWSKIKAFLRAAKARTAETLQAAIAAALQTISPNDARSWFVESGYTFN